MGYCEYSSLSTDPSISSSDGSCSDGSFFNFLRLFGFFLAFFLLNVFSFCFPEDFEAAFLAFFLLGFFLFFFVAGTFFFFFEDPDKIELILAAPEVSDTRSERSSPVALEDLLLSFEEIEDGAFFLAQEDGSLSTMSLALTTWTEGGHHHPCLSSP